MKLIIATCFNGKEINPRYVHSLMELTVLLNEMKVEYEFHCTESKEIDKAKNKIVHEFIKKDFTHIIFIDPDVSWDSRGMARFLVSVKNGAELIGGVYPQYGIYEVNPVMEDGCLKGYNTDKYRIIEVSSVNGGFLMYSRKAFDRIAPNMENYKEITPSEDEETIIEFFKSRNGIRKTEDLFFQKNYRDVGGMIFVEPNITFNLIGKRNWNGNYNQSLLGVEVI